ncbi:Coiled-coil domain-containing protein 93 [Balamuthia mandrillaris]
MSSIDHARRSTSEVLIDTEQIRKYEEIIEMLLAAGYFRARISALSDFDKIVGGLAWCITASNVEVDVDLFFEEEAQIGQKIELGENIVKALIKMKCPFELQAYQIRGLDTERIFPVIQWLVAKVIETREETGDLLRLFSESQFEKRYELPREAKAKEALPSATNFLAEVQDRYKPRRRYRRPSSRIGQSSYLRRRDKSEEESRVQAALLEYGQQHLVANSYLQREEGRGGEDGEGSQIGRGRKLFADSMKDKSREAKEAAEAERKRIEAVMKTFASIGEEDAVSSNKIGSLVGTDADLIREIAASYASKSKGLDLDEEQIQQYFGAELHKRQMITRKRQIEKEQARLERTQETHDELQAQLDAIQEKYAKSLALNKRIEDEIANLEKLETPENAHLLKALRGLVALNENLKKQEAQFRESCQEQRQELRQKIDAMKNRNDDEDNEELRHIKRIEESYETEKQKLKEMQQFRAKRNREIAALQRKMDDIPSRTELQQYQRQFVESFAQVQSKFVETKKYYNSYNTLKDTYSLLQKELSILNSIDENYSVARRSKQSLEKLVASLAQIIEGITTNLQKARERLADETRAKEKLATLFQTSQEEERRFYLMTKQFLKECAVNEKLLAKLPE